MNGTDAFCFSCGTPLLPGAAYCHRCGKPAGPGPAGPEEAAASPEPPSRPGPPEASAAAPPPSSQTPGGAPPGATPGAGGPAPGYGPRPPSTPDEGLARALSGNYPLNMGEWLSRGWSVFTREGGLFLAFAAIGWALWAVTFTVHMTWPILLLAMPLLSAGFMTAALIARRGERLSFSDFWLPFHDFLPLLLSNLVSWALLFAGLCTCGIATVYLWVAYQFASLLILDRRMDFWDALESSRRVVTKQWFGLFAFTAFLALINLAGLATCLGIIVTFPLTVCALTEAYADIFGVRGGLPGGRTPAPAAPPATTPALPG